MANSAATAALTEATAAQAALVPILEGAADYQRLNLEKPAADVIRKAIEDYKRREVLLRRTIEALTALLEDGFPALPIRQINADAYDDLLANQQTIEAALAQFEKVELPTSLGLVAGEPEPKP